MNKLCYRVVFNKARGMMMVVSEITKSQNKNVSNGKHNNISVVSASHDPLNVPYHRLAIAILCCQSMVYTQVQAANSQIQNTASNIPVNQRAALLKAYNGTPIVNIRTPNSKGLSHNTYNKFDIGSNGAILNNSIGSANSNLAGIIAGNQYLAKSSANTILNEVRSNTPVKFQGNLEIAGQQADVIIASPSGLQVQGGGFINANQATLTTGVPKIDSAGRLLGFDIKQGQIQFDPALGTVNALGGELYNGKHKNQANYVDVLARAITVNGKIYANQDINIITGSNYVDSETGMSKTIVGTGVRPTLALDVSNLGGIYAGSISLIGTENGLGVKNSGRITASQQIVLTNSGKIENSGSIQTDKVQTSLVSINATGSTGSVENRGTVSSYGMIDMQADKDILVDNGIIKKESQGTATQLMPDVLSMQAAGDIKVSNNSDVRNYTIDDQANIYLRSGQDTYVDSHTIIGSNGGVSIEADRYVRLLDGSKTFARYAPLTIHSKSGTLIDNSRVTSRGDVHISASKADNTKTSDTVIRNHSELRARNALTVSGSRDSYIGSGSRIVESSDFVLKAGRNAVIDNSGSIKVTNDAVVQAEEFAYLKNNSQPMSIDKQLIIQGKQAAVLNSTANADDGIYISSQGKDVIITNSNLNSDKGAVTAIANQAALKVNKLNIDANSTILAATGDLSIVDSSLTTDNIVIESGKDLTANKVTAVSKDSKQVGSISTKSKGTSDITGSQLNSTGNISVSSDEYLTVIDTGIDSKKNLNLKTKQNIYSNIRLDKNSEGNLYHNYNVSTKQNTFTASEVLGLDSAGRQGYKNTDFKGSAILLNSGSNYILSSNLNLTATGANNNVDKHNNGDIQIVNKGTIALNQGHTINAKKDLIIQADKGIEINKAPKIEAERIQLQTSISKTAKNKNGINNTYGSGDITIQSTDLSATSAAENSLYVNAANHLNIINANIKTKGSTTFKSGNLMRINNSNVDADKDLVINSQSQLVTNGHRRANTNSSLSNTTSGKTTLKADKVVSINSGWAQVHKNTDVIGGAVLIESGSSIGLYENVNLNATGSSTLSSDTTRLQNNSSILKKTLNGDLSIKSSSNLVIDPKKVQLASKGDLSLASTNGQLLLKGYAGSKGLDSELVVNLQAPGDINLSGKEVLIEGSDLISKANGINITAIDGGIELKGIKNSFNNYVSPYKMKSINAEINKAKIELSQPFYDTKWLEDYSKANKEWNNFLASTCNNSSYPGGFGQCMLIRNNDMSSMEKFRPNYYKMTKSTNYEDYMSYLSRQKTLKDTLSDLNQIVVTSKKSATGFEHKAASLKAGKDINITAKQGVLIEGGDITSSTGGITIVAEGNLASVQVKDDNDKTVGINYDSIRITGLADIYQQGDINKAGEVTGRNYSYHQLINQPKLTADKDIKILAQGGRPVNTASKVWTDNNAVSINSADIQSTNGNVRIDAARGDINLEASQVVFMDGSQTTTTKRKWYGKKKTTTTTKTSLNANAMTTDIAAKNIKLTAESDVNIYGSELTADSKGTIGITADRLINLYKVEDRVESETDIKKKSSFLGFRYNKDHTNDTRQELSQLPAILAADSAALRSGGNTLIQGSIFNTANANTIQVGYGKYADADAKVILQAVTNQINTTHNQEKESTVWMKTVDQGSVVTTAQLPKFNQAPTITSPTGVVVAVPVEVTVDSNAKAKAAIQKSQEELGKIALDLSKQPGYEYLATLDKSNDINWVQVDLIQNNWDYTQEGLTPGAAALIAIAVAVAAGPAGPAGSGLSASMVATNAAGIALQTQAVITLINNKGDISKTLKDMASSDTIRNMATAALTAGLGAKLGFSSSVNDPFGQKLSSAIGNGLTKAVADAALNGVSFEEALKNGLRGALVDVFAAEVYSGFVKDFDSNDFADNLAHKLAAAGVGCVTASAKQQDCNAGAIGAAAGEMVGDYLSAKYAKYKIVDNQIIEYYDHNAINQIINTGKVTAGTLALLVGVDVNNAVSQAEISLINNGTKSSVVKKIDKQVAAIIEESQKQVRIMNKGRAGTYYKGIYYNKDGFPEFSSHAIKRIPLERGQKGNYTSDFTEANKKSGYNKTPDGYTWHHHEDGITMELIPTAIHNAARHTGGTAVVKIGKRLAIGALLTTLQGLAIAGEVTDPSTYISSGSRYIGPDGKTYEWEDYSKKFLKNK